MIDRDDPEYGDVFKATEPQKLLLPDLTEDTVFFRRGVQCRICGHYSGPDGKHKPSCPRNT